MMAALIFLAGMFTNFFGLGDLWENRGSWYLIMPNELETVMANLYRMNAFADSDGIQQGSLKIKVYTTGIPGGVYYRIKIPDWVFKYQATKLDEQTKAELLGISLK